MGVWSRKPVRTRVNIGFSHQPTRKLPVRSGKGGVNIAKTLLGKRAIKAGREIAGAEIGNVHRNIRDNHICQRTPVTEIGRGLDGLGLVDLGVKLAFEIGVGARLRLLEQRQVVRTAAYVRVVTPPGLRFRTALRVLADNS